MEVAQWSSLGSYAGNQSLVSQVNKIGCPSLSSPRSPDLVGSQAILTSPNSLLQRSGFGLGIWRRLMHSLCCFLDNGQQVSDSHFLGLRFLSVKWGAAHVHTTPGQDKAGSLCQGLPVDSFNA